MLQSERLDSCSELPGWRCSCSHRTFNILNYGRQSTVPVFWKCPVNASSAMRWTCRVKKVPGLQMVQTVLCRGEVVEVDGEGADLAISAKQPIRCSKPLSRVRGRLFFAASNAPVTAAFTSLACKPSENPLAPCSMQHLYCMLTCRTKTQIHHDYGLLAAWAGK